MTPFLTRCRGAGGKRPAHVGDPGVILVLVAWRYNNAVRKTPYPHYW